MHNKPLVVLVCVFVLGLTWHERVAAEVDYCKFSENKALLLVDRTSTYDGVDQEILIEGLEAMYNGLKPGDRLIVHTITDSRANSEKIFDRCYPGCPKVGLVDWFVSSCRAGLARSEMVVFRADLASKLHLILSENQEYSYSAIVETIATTTSRYDSIGLTAVLMYSDLLENSQLLPWPKVVTSRRDTTLKTLTDLGLNPRLTGLSVVVFGVGRNHDSQRTPLSARRRHLLEKFWRSLFETSGADIVHIGERYRQAASGQ